MKRILFCEDEQSIRDFVVINLRRAGYEVFTAETGEDAIAIYDNEQGLFDIALLDIMLPGIDGTAVCCHIREQNSRIGIIMLTAKTQEMDRVGGLMMGADDYITKPFSPSELVARVDALARRVTLSSSAAQTGHSDELRSGDFVLSMRSRTLSHAGKTIELTQVEFQIMEYFFSNPGVALERNSILEHVWGKGYYGEEKIVDVNIRRLRMKIEVEPSCPRHITTVWGLGYKWEV